MNDITTQVINEADVDFASVQLYDPTQAHGLIAKFVVNCETPQGVVGFICRQVEINRILLELPEEIALALQNFKADDQVPDEDADLTSEDLQRARYLHEYNVTAVMLGLVQPELTPSQIRDLPTTIIRDLSDAITDFNPDADETNA